MAQYDLRQTIEKLQKTGTELSAKVEERDKDLVYLRYAYVNTRYIYTREEMFDIMKHQELSLSKHHRHHIEKLHKTHLQESQLMLEEFSQAQKGEKSKLYDQVLLY